MSTISTLDTFLKSKNEIDGIDLNQNNPDGLAWISSRFIEFLFGNSIQSFHFNESYLLKFSLIGDKSLVICRHIVDNKKFNSTFKDDKMEAKNDNTHDINLITNRR